MSLSYPTLPSTALNTGTPNTPALYTNQLIVGGIDLTQSFSVASGSYDMTFNGNVIVATGKSLKTPVTNNNITPPNLVCYDTTNKSFYYTTTMPATGASLSANNVFTGTNTITLDATSKVAITAGSASNCVSIGAAAGGSNTLNTGSVNIGYQSGSVSQGSNSVCIGNQSGFQSQSNNCLALGAFSGGNNQFPCSVAIGSSAGVVSLGNSSIVIGYKAGETVCPNNCIILNATGGALNGVAAQTDSFYVAPIRANNIACTNILNWNSTTKEITCTNTTFSYGYYYNLSSQNIPNNIETIVTFPSLSRTIGTLGITYANGVFTNTSGVTMLLSVTAQYIYPNTNYIGNRTNYLNHSVLGYIAMDSITAAYSVGLSHVANFNCTFTMLSNENFRFLTTQDSGVALLLAVNGTSITTFCSITRLN